jgi:CRP-like cAMP-binding protein
MPANDWLPASVRAAAIDRRLKSGETLFRLGEKTTGLYEVLVGRVRLARVDRSGQEIVLHVAGPGETIAEASLFSPQYHCDAIASTNATVRVYPKREVLNAFERDPKAAKAFSATLEALYRAVAALERGGAIRRSREKIMLLRRV